MDIIRAKEILEILADGVNPMTGEVLPGSDSCNQVEVVRAIHAVLKHIDLEPEKPKRPQPENAGKPWTEEDEEVLSRMFDTGCTRKEILAVTWGWARLKAPTRRRLTMQLFS